MHRSCKIMSHQFKATCSWSCTKFNTREISQLFDLSKSQVWKILLKKRLESHDDLLANKTTSMKQYLVKKLGNHTIGYEDVDDWPPHSSDLTPLNFVQWGYQKHQVYATPSSSWGCSMLMLMVIERYGHRLL